MSYLLDGGHGDDEEQWEATGHGTRGCVDDKLQDRGGHWGDTPTSGTSGDPASR